MIKNLTLTILEKQLLEITVTEKYEQWGLI